MFSRTKGQIVKIIGNILNILNIRDHISAETETQKSQQNESPTVKQTTRQHSTFSDDKPSQPSLPH